jgi:peptide/nickel transport system permease protein
VSEAAAPAAPRVPNRLGALWRAYAGSPLAVAAAAVLLLTVLAGAAAPVIAPQDPYDLAGLSLFDGRLPPLSRGADGLYLLGTDDQSRDMLSAILYGLRTSLTVGLVATAAAAGVGTPLGLLAAWKGGRVDSLVMRLVDLQLSLPAILVALALLAALGRGEDKIILALALVQWAVFARTARASAAVERQRDYVAAAQCLGLPARRVLFGHVLPNALPPITVIAAVEVAHAIGLEATLSFLGVGLPVARPSLGLLIANGFQYLLNGQYWISMFPGVALLVLVFALNLVADRLREVLDPRGTQG